jgi:hypothetical protein
MSYEPRGLISHSKKAYNWCITKASQHGERGIGAKFTCILFQINVLEKNAKKTCSKTESPEVCQKQVKEFTDRLWNTADKYKQKLGGAPGWRRESLVDNYLNYLCDDLRLPALEPRKTIGYDDPNKFRFKPPGTKEPHGYIKGYKSPFQRKPLGVRESEDLENIIEIGPITAGVMIAGTASLISLARRTYKEFYGRANRACGNLKGSEGRLCRKQYKVEAIKAEIQALRYARSKCKRTKDPKVCVQKLNKRINSILKDYPDIQYAAKEV